MFREGNFANYNEIKTYFRGGSEGTTDQSV